MHAHGLCAYSLLSKRILHLFLSPQPSRTVSHGNFTLNSNNVFYFPEKKGTFQKGIIIHMILSILATTPLLSVSINSPSLPFHEEIQSMSSATWASCGISSDCLWSHCLTVTLSLSSYQDLLIISHLNKNKHKVPQYF